MLKLSIDVFVIINVIVYVDNQVQLLLFVWVLGLFSFLFQFSGFISGFTNLELR